MPCQTCTTYRKFIKAMLAEFNRYGHNKTAQYYKGQCEKVLREKVLRENETDMEAPE